MICNVEREPEMDKVRRIKVVVILVCSCLFLFGPNEVSLVLADEAIGNAANDEEKEQQGKSTGMLDFIGKTSVTIDDLAYKITSVTHYRTAGGGVTGSGHFSIGDIVEFMFDPQEMTIIELRMKSSGDGERNNTKEKKSDGVLKLEDGVWIN